MTKELNNYAFIDSQNLNLGVRAQGWELDFASFRVYLKDKHNITKAFLFIGYVKGNEALYTYLQESGYICIFKPTLELPAGEIKGNVKIKDSLELTSSARILGDISVKVLTVEPGAVLYGKISMPGIEATEKQTPGKRIIKKSTGESMNNNEA